MSGQTEKESSNSRSSVLGRSRGGVVHEFRAVPAEGGRRVAPGRAALGIAGLVDVVGDGEGGGVGGPVAHGPGEVELADEVAAGEEGEGVPAVAGGRRRA